MVLNSIIIKLSDKKRGKIIIMISGRGSNMKAILENIKKGKLKDICEVHSVFSNKIDAPGLQIAEKFGIPTMVIESKGKKKATYNKLLYEYLDKQSPDFIILAGYMKILSSEIIKRFPQRIINIHPADTTLHQGLHGYQWAFENKLDSTVITVHFVDEGLDSGKVIGKKKVDLREAGSLDEVEKRGLVVEHEFYSECLLKIFKEKKVLSD